MSFDPVLQHPDPAAETPATLRDRYIDERRAVLMEKGESFNEATLLAALEWDAGELQLD